MKKRLAFKDSILSKEWFPELIRYVFAGGIAFVLDFLVLMVLYKVFDVYYLTATALGLIVGLFTTYLLSIKWVFNNRAVSNRTSELSLFLLIGSIGFLINEYVIWVSVEALFLSVPVSKVVATAIVFFWNFTARKVILFKKHNADNE
ncbi:MAG: GtrA family protein [Clostridiales bacterium]|nr:GtrA family protein [Clostridiales bacterium]